MKLTTKILKEMIAQELSTMREAEEVVEEQEVSEGMENITPENIMMVIDALQHIRIKLRWKELDVENQAIELAKEAKVKIFPQIIRLSNY